ncbi:MAG: amidase family protein, partial [Burkholderiales bacterium]
MTTDRRAVLAAGAALLLPRAAGARTPMMKTVSVEERSLADLQADMTAGRTSARRLVAAYTERILRIDRAGPKLASVIELNPDAPAIAQALDDELKSKGPRSPLHGLPILIKDNIATHDRMETTAGSLGLFGSRPPDDAAVVKRLRAAGAVILGKTNLSEWANIRSTTSTSGWSARGGLTRNPYALDRNTSGSSSGSAAAAAASLCAAAVGSETDGSILSPASICGLVGLKPTVGLIGGAGIVPIAHSQDTAGPMARSVRDCAL